MTVLEYVAGWASVLVDDADDADAGGGAPNITSDSETCLPILRPRMVHNCRITLLNRSMRLTPRYLNAAFLGGVDITVVHDIYAQPPLLVPHTFMYARSHHDATLPTSTIPTSSYTPP